ncbi:hypothetical protein [Solirubrobacter soli]|uniref:hypothetical protein n=1 Tax=Solirubrobacter soli TaxID=363832 RepID=UPI0003F84070|nr:hypothetical protein [Solirubrobacter soli]
MLRRQQRLGDVLISRRAAVGLLAAAALAGCGGADAAEQPQDEAVVAHAVAPPQLEDEKAPDTSLPEAGQDEDRNALPTATPEQEDEPARRKSRSNAILSDADRASFNRLAQQLGGEQGLAVSGVGTGRRVERVGSLNSVIAWSTSKVPVAMAVVDAGGQGAQQQNLAAAITASDNGAATRLWDSLGSADQAAAAADDELRRGGDQSTQVQARTLRSGLTPFGQTVWTLADQARFTAAMPCSASGQAVLNLMGQVIPAQKWGLGSAGVPAQLKGGWGPGSQPGQGGGYLNRQMGIIDVAGKPLAVAIASRPSDGSHESGTRALTSIAHWLVEHANMQAVPAQAAC